MPRGSLSYLGRTDDALNALERATAGGFYCYPALVRDPGLDPVRALPKFAQTLREVEARHRGRPVPLSWPLAATRCLGYLLTAGSSQTARLRASGPRRMRSPVHGRSPTFEKTAPPETVGAEHRPRNTISDTIHSMMRRHEPAADHARASFDPAICLVGNEWSPEPVPPSENVPIIGSPCAVLRDLSGPWTLSPV